MLLRIQISNLPPKASFTNPHVFLVFLFNEDLEDTADVYYALINVFWTLKASRWVSDTGRQKITSESNRHTYSVNVKQPDACNNLTSEDCTSERLNTEVEQLWVWWSHICSTVRACGFFAFSQTEMLFL